MILTFESTAPEYNGRVDETVILRSGTRGVARTRSRPSTARQRQAWHPPWLFTPATEAWAGLDALARASWEGAADTLSAWPIQGSPRFTTAQVFFQNYYTVLLLLDAGAAVPTAPPSGPLWQTLPQWFEFAEWIDNRYTLKAQTDFDAGTQLLFSGLPPSATVFNGEWFGEQIIGNNTFTAGLSGDEDWDGIHDMFVSTYGAINRGQKIWGRVWEVYPGTGFIRVLKDPCTVDPEPTGETFIDIEVYNAYSVTATQLNGSVVNIGGTQQETWNIFNVPSLSTRYFRMNFPPGMTTFDIGRWSQVGWWTDGSTQATNVYMPFGYEPLEVYSYPTA